MNAIVEIVKQKFNQPVRVNMLIKILICLNLVGLAFCWKISDIRITEDKETQDYINYLEETLERDQEYHKMLWNYINYLEEN